MAEGGEQLQDGLLARYFDVPVGPQTGCFDRLRSGNVAKRAALLAKSVARTIKENYGCAIGPLVDHINEERDTVVAGSKS